MSYCPAPALGVGHLWIHVNCTQIYVPWDQLVCWEFQAAFGDYGHIIKIETPLNGTAAPRKQHRAIRYIIFRSWTKGGFVKRNELWFDSQGLHLL